MLPGQKRASEDREVRPQRRDKVQGLGRCDAVGGSGEAGAPDHHGPLHTRHLFSKLGPDRVNMFALRDPEPKQRWEIKNSKNSSAEDGFCLAQV